MNAPWPAPLDVQPPRRFATAARQRFLAPADLAPRLRLRRFPVASLNLGWSAEVDLWTDHSDGDASFLTGDED